MKSPEKKENRLSVGLARVCGVLAAGFGFIALLGWIAGLSLLSTPGSGRMPMAPSTALLFLLYGAGALVLARSPLNRAVYRIGIAIGSVGTLAALLLLLLSSLGIRPEAEYLGIRVAGTVNGAPVGHMSPLTAFCFVLVGFSFLATLSSSSDRRWRAPAAFAAACLVVLTSLVLLLAYLFQAPFLYGSSVIPPALYTSLAFLILGTGLLLASGQRTWPRVGESRSYVLAFALGAVLLVVFVGYRIRSTYQMEMAYWQGRQTSVAEDRAQRLSDWLNERQADAGLFSTRPSVRAALRAYYTSGHLPGRSRGGRPDLTAVLDEMARLYPDAGVYVLDRDVQVVAQSSHAVPLSPALAEVCRTAARTKAVQIDLLGDAPDKTLISFSVPVLPEPGTAEARPSPGQPLGVTLLAMEAPKTLFPLVAREGVPTRTGETVLVRREGNEIVFFSPLRHVPAGSPNLRYSFSTAPLPARAALEGRETSLESTDYRGVVVLTATRRIPLTGWGLVGKIDRAEALEEFHQQAIVEGVAAGLLVILLAGLLVFHRRHVLGRVMEREEEKFRALLESAPDAMVIVDREGRIALVNAQAERIFGFDRQELVGQPVEMLVPEWARAKHREGCRHFFSEPAAHHVGASVEMRGLRKDGTEFPLEAKLSPIETVEGVFVSCGIRDITERQQAEEAVRKSESSLAEAQRIAHMGNWEWDIVTNELGWSDEIFRIFGLTPQSFGATYDAFLDAVHPEDRELVDRAVRESVLRQTPYAVDHRIVRPDGAVRVVHEQGEVCYDQDAKPSRMVGTVHDITERKRAEDEILKLNRELEEKVAARTADLLATNKELEAFTYSVSHDLRAPLRHVDGFSKLLQEQHGKDLSAGAQECLSTIRNAVLRMGLLIDDLLSLARVGRTELSVRETGLSSLVEEVMADLRRANPQRAIEWKVETLPFVECDPALMKQVFANLLSNAVKFTRPRKPAEIEVGATGQDGRQVVFVRDNGVGFSMKYADKLFGVFQRLHRAEDFEGTGVGLATVQRIIHKHGGRIWAEAELNKGATFYFMLGTPDGRGAEN